MVILETERLYLRTWQEDDLAGFVVLNADEKVMQHFPAPLTPAQSQVFLTQIQDKIALEGFGFWACVLKDSDEVIGFVGLNRPSDTFFFSPCVEIGWRIHRRFQKQGLAQEAARAVIAYGFDVLGLDKIVAFTAVPNVASAKLMQRLGMKKNCQHFLHPRLEPTHRLAEHVLYELSLDCWQSNR